MSRARLIIDGETRLDNTLDEWHKKPPALLADMIKPGTKTEPYMKAAAIALAEATIQNNPITIIIDTFASGGWSMHVHHKLDVPAIGVPTHE